LEINKYVPFISTLVMALFVVFVLRRYFATKKVHFLFWGIGLAMFGAGSFAEAYFAFGWNKWIFFLWYLCGAALTAAWIGHGTLKLLVRKKWADGATILLVLTSLWTTYLMFQVMPDLDASLFNKDIPISEQYATKKVKAGDSLPEGVETAVITYKGEEVTIIPRIMPYKARVRSMTPWLNIYGMLTLVGGAIYSGFLFWRKRVMPHRVIGNVLIAAGGLLIASASSLTRAGYGQFLYLGELFSAILMFWGFIVSSKSSQGDQPGKA